MYNEWEEKYNEKNKEYGKVKEEYKKIKEENEELSDKISKLEKDLKKERKNAEEDKEELEDKIKKFKNKLSEAEEEKEEVEKKLKKVKKELEELQDSPRQPVVRVDDSKSLELQGEISKLENKLAEWEDLFPDQNPKELKRIAEEAGNHQKRLEELKGKLEVAKKENSPEEDISKISAEMREVADKYVKLGGDAGGFFLGPVGSIIGANLATFHGVLATGTYTYEQTRKGLQEVSEHLADNAADIAKRWMDGADKNFKGVLNLFSGTGSLELEIRMLKEQLEEKKREIKELKDSQNLLTAQVVEVATSRSNSPIPR